MNKDNMKPITDPKDIPSNLSDEVEIAFWEKHSVTEEYLAKTEEVPEEERPRPRGGTRSISVRFDDHTLARLRKLADAKGVGYQTLLKEFVTERLYEEEKRAGIMPFDSPKASEHLIGESVNETRAQLAALVAAQIANTPFEITPQDMDPLSQTIEEQVEKQIESELRDYEAAIRTHLQHTFEKTREDAETYLSHLAELGKPDEEQRI